MKIAFVGQPWDKVALPSLSLSGSIVIWAHAVARRLVRSAEVCICVPRARLQQKAEYYEEVLFRRFSVAPDRWLSKWRKRLAKGEAAPLPEFMSDGYYRRYITTIARDLRKKKYDIVHIYNFPHFARTIRAFNPQIKIVLHMQCDWLIQFDAAEIQRRIGCADLIVGCSEYITEGIRRKFPVFANRCATIYNGADVNCFTPNSARPKTRSDSDRLLLFVGRVSPEKGVHVLLDAFHTVVQQYPRARLAIAGYVGTTPWKFVFGDIDDPMAPRLAEFWKESYLARLQKRIAPSVANRVSFVGPMVQSRLVDYYRDADVLIVPSVWNEPFGMPLVEAMACGVPTVGTRGGGITEIIENGTTGLLVDRDDAPGLARAVLQLLQDDDARHQMGQAARQRAVALFSWDRVAENVLSRYRDMCGQGRHRSERDIPACR